MAVREEEQENTQRHEEEAWYYLEKRMYEQVIEKRELVRWTFWELLATGIDFYIILYGGIVILLYPPWHAITYPLVGSLLAILLLILIIELHLRGERVRRTKAGLPPPRLILPSWPIWKNRFPWWVTLVDILAGFLAGYVLSFALTPLLIATVRFLGVTLRLDFILSWDLSVLMAPTVLVTYILLRNRVLKQQWRTWWTQEEKRKKLERTKTIASQSAGRTRLRQFNRTGRKSPSEREGMRAESFMSKEAKEPHG